MNPPRIEDRIEGGELVYMGFTPEGRVWWLNEPYEEIEPAVIRRMGNRLVEMGDSLFGWPGFSQTWRGVGQGAQGWKRR